MIRIGFRYRLLVLHYFGNKIMRETIADSTEFYEDTDTRRYEEVAI
jgi:hypothetical protein